MARALRAQQEAASLHFDWPDAGGAVKKLREEIEELEALLRRPPDQADPSAVRNEVGDLLFAAVNVARLCRVAPGPALSAATRKFEKRFGELLRRAERSGIEPSTASLAELDLLWESVKRDELESIDGNRQGDA